MSNRVFRIVALVAVGAVVASLIVAIALRPGGRTVTAYFASGEGVFEDNAVRVLGVPVGQITSVTPDGTRVRVDVEITDDDLKLPADVRAVVVSPSVVTGRYIQFTPTYASGPELESGAVIPIERTAVPLGVDDLARTASQLATALGPQGANSTGALSDAITVGAQNLDGNGQAFNDSVRNIGELSGTLSDSREELFGTVRELQLFVSNIKQRDGEIREFNDRLQEVSRFLADDRDDLGDAFRELSIALGDVAAFVRDNREILDSNVERLVKVTDAVVRQRKALKEILDVAPAGLNNIANAYNSTPGTLDTRVNAGGDGPETGGLTALLCTLAAQIYGAGMPPIPFNQTPIGVICSMVVPSGMSMSAPEVVTALSTAGISIDQLPGLVVPTDEPGAIPDVTTLPAAPVAPAAPAEPGAGEAPVEQPAESAPGTEPADPEAPDLLGPAIDPLTGPAVPTEGGR